MCLQALLPIFAGGGAAAGATAAGAAATAGSLLQTVGLITSVGGALMQGAQAAKIERMNAAAVAQQRTTEAQLTATEDQRVRMQFRSAMRRQGAELVARGISLDSPTAVLLGQTAAQEMSFASQEVRSRGAARQTELTASEQMYRARASGALLKGTFDAAGSFLTGAPDIWPELLA